MAITKLLHMKECSGKRGYIHLKNAIQYILNEEKSGHGLYVDSNCGSDWKEILNNMLKTKSEAGKKHGRQGYHFILSFKKGETDAETAYRIAGEFVQKYLLDNYDYVYAVHDDKEHIHAHIVFNSVSYDGLKYHYANGDWKKSVQPVTNELCRKYGLSEILLQDSLEQKKRTEKGKKSGEADRKPERKAGKSYAEWDAERQGKMTWREAIRLDLDAAVRNSGSYEELAAHMRMNGYEVKEGSSKKHARFLAVKPCGSAHFFYSYSLGRSYTVPELEKRIAIEERRMRTNTAPKPKKIRITGYSQGKRPGNASLYQLYHVGRYYRIRHFYNYKGWEYRQDLLKIDQIYRQCCYLLKNGIHDRRALESREKILHY